MNGEIIHFKICLGKYLKHLKGAPLGYTLALLANIRLGWKDREGTNILA
jgi:hypothetical protein